MMRIGVLGTVPYLWVVVGLCVVITMALAMPAQGMGALFPFIQEDLQATRVQVGLIAAGLYGGGGASVLLLGWLVDVVGVRRVGTLALLWLTGSLLLFSQIQSVLQGVLVGVLIGAALNASPPVVTRAVMDWVTQRTRALAMGTNEASITVGGIIAAVLLTFLAVTLGWRAGVMIVAFIIAVLSTAFIAFYRDKPDSQLDCAMRTKSSGKLAQVAKNRDIWLMAFLGISFAVAQNVLVTYLVLFMREHLSMSPGAAGGLLAVSMAGGAVGRIGWAAVSDFLLHGRRVVLLVLLGPLAVASLSLMALLPSNTSLLPVSVLVFIVGVTTMGRSGLMLVLTAELAGPGLTGTAVGFVATIALLGAVGIIPLFGLIVDQTESYGMAWWMAAALVGAGTLVLAFLRGGTGAGDSGSRTPGQES